MKIPNFLHLTPPVISKQCEALKKFCTPWPKGLETEEKQEQHFPVRVISSDYVHGLPTIRNPLSRIVTIKLKLSRLNLNQHARDKFLRLVDERYNPETDEVTIVTDRCPLKKQNFDYAMYLLTGKHQGYLLNAFLKTNCSFQHFITSRMLLKSGRKRRLKPTWKLTFGTTTSQSKQQRKFSIGNLTRNLNRQENMDTPLKLSSMKAKINTTSTSTRNK